MSSTVPKCWAKKGWIDVGSDVSWEDYGGHWGKRAAEGVWFFVKFENMAEHMSESEMKEGGYALYYAQVKQVDLREVPVSEVEAAMKSCGPDDLSRYDEAEHEMIHATCCADYGTYAPLDEFQGPRALQVRADAFRCAESYMADADSLDSALDRPVNKIGSTARDFRGGNCLAGLERYTAQIAGSGSAPDATKNLMLKMYGVDAQKVAEAPCEPVVKRVRHRDLSAECWLVQMHGTAYCATCPEYGREDCGGKEILRTGQNENGIEVDGSGLVSNLTEPKKPREL